MRRAVITASATAAGVVLLLSLKPHDPSTAAAISSSPVAGGPRSSAGPTSSPSAPSPSASSTAASGGTRTVTGNAVNTRYGPVQVRVTLDGSTISKIDVIQYPNRDRRDQEINSYAVPELNQEAMAAQNAHIDVVSGATYTSDGYTRSLQSALDRAAKK
ncbi:FMN-binding protein [Kitasatospora sp. CB02891]|uniref:FMN-binding protein n=1 Tax=Kitasatospora sp. CB02891 TaxID=2020329 RepID=UPI000C27EE96|nr:FMN-binding protein [Kitasatospora sp. CB02891]PJN21609.1 FMN-binding protein [Kitasatospora sp. CB02891]